MTTVWVVMSEYKIEDDGNMDRDIVSVHSTHDAAVLAAETPEDEWHQSYVMEMDLL